MHRRTTRMNRMALLWLGAILSVLGIGLVLLQQGLFGARAAATKIYPDPVQEYLAGHRWVYWAVAVVAVIVVGTGLRWLVAQLRTDRLSRLAVDSERRAGSGSGTTRLTAGALTAAISDDVRAIPGVRSANVSLAGRTDSPELWLRVTVARDADTGAVRSALLGPVLADARSALEHQELPAFITLLVSNKVAARAVR